MAQRIPRIAPTVLERARIGAWMASHAKTAVRLLCAPAGSGKTTAAVLYARNHPDLIAFVALAPDTSEAALIHAVAESLGLSTVRGYGELLEQLATVGPVEIIVDNADNADLGARAVLGRIFLDVPDNVTFVYVTRSEDAISLHAGRARGLVEVCDAAYLAFDLNEITLFAHSLAVEIDTIVATALFDQTDGWAIAVCGSTRLASTQSLRLLDALSEWRRVNRIALLELANDAANNATPSVALAFAELVAAGIVPDRVGLDAFRRAGLFVVERNGQLALNPVLDSEVRASSQARRATEVVPATIEMFGRFEMSIGGMPVDWIRRRDRQIVAFLATRPYGRATRAEIITAFWPDGDRQLAGQSLRSACSTIRRAIGACVGRTNVEHYFIGEYELGINLNNTIVSSREFSAAHERGVAAILRGDRANAFVHFRAAELRYRSPFLAGEAPTAWAAEYETHFATVHAEIAARLDDLGAAQALRNDVQSLRRLPAIRQVSA